MFSLTLKKWRILARHAITGMKIARLYLMQVITCRRAALFFIAKFIQLYNHAVFRHKQKLKMVALGIQRYNVFVKVKCAIVNRGFSLFAYDWDESM
jgi:hypothetical protein